MAPGATALRTKGEESWGKEIESGVGKLLPGLWEERLRLQEVAGGGPVS